MILTKSQAEAVYSAMCVLNNVNGKISVIFDNCSINEYKTGKVDINTRQNVEIHNSQNDFAKAYSLS